MLELGVLRALLLPSLWGQTTLKHPQGKRHAARRCLISLLWGALLTGLCEREALAELAIAEQMTFLSVKWDFYRVLLLQVLGGDNKVQALSPAPPPSHWVKPRKLKSLSSGTQGVEESEVLSS